MNITSLRFSDHQPQSIFFIQKMVLVLQTLKWNQIKLNFEMVSLCILQSYCKAHYKYTGIIKQVEIKKKKEGCIDGSNPIISLNANTRKPIKFVYIKGRGLEWIERKSDKFELSDMAEDQKLLSVC